MKNMCNAPIHKVRGKSIPSLSLAGLVATALFCISPVLAGSFPAASPLAVQGTTVITSDWQAELLSQSKKSPPAAGVIERGDAGIKLGTRVQAEFAYNLQAQLKNQITLKKGDTLFIRFAARSLKADKSVGSTKVRLSFQKRSGDAHSNSYNGEIGFSAEWVRCDIPFTCATELAPGEASMSFAFGYPPQEVEIADVQMLRFPPDISPSALPKTKRHTDPVPRAVIQAEVARIASMRNSLVTADPSPANGRTLHVSPKGGPAGNGSAESPFATIPQALAIVKPGETILVAAGTYIEPRGVSIKTSGRPDAWIRIKAAPGPRPKIVSSGWSGIGMSGGICYVEIQGLELQWVPNPKVAKQVDGVGLAPAYACHHLRFINNVIHGFGTGGLCALDCDYLHVEGNIIYNTSKTSPYGGSAISLCRAFNLDENPGYHNVVRGNVCYDNELLVSVLETSGGNGRTLTDGNGIIIDVFKRSRANPRKPHTQDRGGALEPYRGRTLIENNLIYDNGGRGIHVFRSEKVDIVNNTCYMNQKSADINAGELTAIQSSEVVFLNNIAYGRKEKRGNTQDGSTRIIWSHNLFYHSDDVMQHDGIIEADPRFVAPSLKAAHGAFRLQSGSPALGRALANASPPADIAGAPRPKGAPADLGCYQISR